MPRLEFTTRASEELARLEADPSQVKRAKITRRMLGFLEKNPRHGSLNTHEYKNTPCPHGGKLFEAYVQNNTPGAYRIFWCYMPPPARDVILIVAITAHP